jgi:preprotein translocase subunit YajC
MNSSNGLMILMVQFLAIGLVFYFLILRPQAKARKRAAEMLAAIKKGDEITTAGGIIGKVREVKDLTVLVESGTATLLIERARIIRVGDTVTPGAQA